MLLRYLYLHKRSLPRMFEIVFWPVMELLLWGFVSMYLRGITDSPTGKIFAFFIGAMIFWDILYRTQQAVSIAIIEDIWTQNIVNILVSPLKIWEWILATFIYGLIKISLITLILSLLAFGLYHYHVMNELHFYMVPLAANLLLFGWALGVATSGLVIRYGHSAEALIWGVPYLVQPLSAIYYPVDVLPNFLQKIAYLLPSTYVFEGIRAVSQSGQMPYEYLFKALILNFVYFILAGIAFNYFYQRAKSTGRLARLGMD